MAVSRAKTSAIDGVFQRHCSPRVTTLSGSPAGGRWGPAGAFPVLYLGRPTASVTIEAYRHLVDDVEGMTGDEVGPRTLWTCQVAVTNVLDLRQASSRDAVSLTLDHLSSAVDEYEKCQRVAQAAYRMQLHGIIAPSAGGLGETLALFEDHLPANELPVVLRRETWARLPADPRQLRGIAGGAASG
ncbi:RES family NAD+ phosphorylase [Georgenia sp. TF02-10]|uniref:RES family NAD+ phosphorylase n=1 Tax=Georgenia sp. TF02-10 TaxID=2917725 RepID=UPI001FA6AEAB|nr:RES family NAD+ phosphorylase [Georgenia sp. TF02-10]UNX53436.1 RES family NAD+ phosphorylase [Georgenia sp. TF02-10]